MVRLWRTLEKNNQLSLSRFKTVFNYSIYYLLSVFNYSVYYLLSVINYLHYHDLAVVINLDILQA
jgi:hypothetical protein